MRARGVIASGSFCVLCDCVFAKEVVQYWNDSLSDPYGKVSTLYQDIAKDIFEDTDGVMFCTGEY